MLTGFGLGLGGVTRRQGVGGGSPPETLAPLQSDLTAWYDASSAATLFQEISAPATPSVSGDVVGTWKDRKLAYDMAAPADGNRGSLLTLDGKKRIRTLSASSHRYTNATIPINRRAGAIFVVGRNFGHNTAQALVHFPASGASTFALYNNNNVQITNDPLYVYHGAGVDTGLKIGYRGSLETSFVMGGAATAYAGIGRELYTKGSAWTAATATGGNIGYWNGTFPANYEFCEVLIYGRELTLIEKDSILAYLEAKWPVVKTSETRFICATGDSITAGDTSPNNGDINSPLVQLLTTYGASPPKAVNGGIGGQALSANTAATREVAALSGNTAYANRLLIVMYGINDITAGRTEAQIKADIDTFLASVNTGDSGALVYWRGILPKTGLSGAQETIRVNVNTYLASLVGTTIDYYLDLGADARLANAADTTYYIDGLHPTVAGNAVIAELDKAKLVAVGWP